MKSGLVWKAKKDGTSKKVNTCEGGGINISTASQLPSGDDNLKLKLNTVQKMGENVFSNGEVGNTELFLLSNNLGLVDGIKKGDAYKVTETE